MVSVLEGQLSRTWYFLNQGRNHVVNLYHDTITGVRSAMVDFNEIRGSIGNSSLLMDSKGHRIFFSVDSLPGYIEIKRSGWSGFSYACVINNVRIPEATEVVSDDQSEVFKVKILGTTTTQDEMSEHLLTWYVLETTRIADGAVTTIHRRFRDFAEFNSQVKQNFKGHHLRDMLPPLPEKPLKSLTDHKDPQFIYDRQLKLETFLVAIVSVPHVPHMICTKAFLGIMDRVKEYSVSFHVPQLGMSLIPYTSQAAAKAKQQQHLIQQDDVNTPVVVGSILKPDVCVGVSPGDTISKINGMPVAGTSFQGIIARIKLLPRPIIIHFISVIGGNPVMAPGAEDTTDSNHEQEHQQNQRYENNQQIKHTHSGNQLEAYEQDNEASPLDHGPRAKKPDLFDAAYQQNDESEKNTLHYHTSNVKQAQPKAPVAVDNGPSQSEIAAAKQAELSEASRKALEALSKLDEKDDDLLFGSATSSSKKNDGMKSLFGSSSAGRGRNAEPEEDLFAPLVKKTPPAAPVSPAPAPAVQEERKPEVAANPLPPTPPKQVTQQPETPPLPPAAVAEVVVEPMVEKKAEVQIDPFADDFVEESAATTPAAVAVEEIHVAQPAQPAPLGWDD